MKVLVIDDHESLRGIVPILLGEDHEVRTAESGARGLELLEQEEFDVVLCDLEMPEIDGLEVWRRMPRRMRGRFVMWTGSPEVPRGVEFPVMTKPVEAAELRRQLEMTAEWGDATIVVPEVFFEGGAREWESRFLWVPTRSGVEEFCRRHGWSLEVRESGAV
jgi:CheY-like chemotaxis protein